MGVRRIALVALLGTLALARGAAADEIVVQGDTLRGTTKDGGAFTIQFLPDGANAKGEVLITKS